MVQSCCYCGLPLQRATQYVGIADVIIGLLHFILMTVHVKEIFESDAAKNEGTDYQSTQYDSRRTKIRVKTFPSFEFIPRELVVTILVCYGVQATMGVFLYASAVNKNRRACCVWLGVTAITALFTHIFIRLYEMLIVNEFILELKMEQEVTYFPGSHNLVVPPPQQQYHAHLQQPMYNPLTPSADIQANFVTIPTVTPMTYTPNGHSMDNGYYYGHGQYHGASSPQPQYVPAALQPPPQYEVAVAGGMYNQNMNTNSNDNGTGVGSSAGHSMQFPNAKNEYGNSFTKF